jgi:toxin-antitoxin system PIN domain toxin
MTASSDPALIDTNVLVYAVFPAVPNHAASRALVDIARTSGANLYVAPQNLVEFFAVVTDPRRVTQPKSSDEALQAIDDILALPGLSLLPVPSDMITRWAALLRQSPATKKRAFDAQLVATMVSNGVMNIYSFNTADFQQFSFAGIQILKP